MKCPCCSALTYQSCCQVFIDKIELPDTPEQLMRSRFSAYALNHPQYIVDTYSKQEQEKLDVNDIAQWAKENKWIKLVVYPRESLSNDAVVEFSAFYINNNQLIEMRELSNFVQEDQWKYKDGEILKHAVIAELKRNDTCPCDSGKKYKKWCGR